MTDLQRDELLFANSLQEPAKLIFDIGLLRNCCTFSMASSSRSPEPVQPEGTYNVHQSHPLASAAYEASELHLHAAALYITTHLDNHGVPNALMGGFSMYLRGSTRVTHDIDVAIGCDMQTLLQALNWENGKSSGNVSFDELIASKCCSAN